MMLSVLREQKLVVGWRKLRKKDATSFANLSPITSIPSKVNVP